MLIIHHELLPDTYLLVMASDPATTSERELAQYLSAAAQSGKPAVWVDCWLLTAVSPTAARLLAACHYRLQQRRAELVLCRVSAQLARMLQHYYPGSDTAWCPATAREDATTQSPPDCP